MSDKEFVELVGDWGNPPYHARSKSVKRVSPFLLRECPDCGKPKLRLRQRYCDGCTQKRRRKSKREYQRDFRKKHRVST